jgi:hypothetical protein
MTIKEFKVLIENAPDEAELAIMLFANKYRMEYVYPKRALLLKDRHGNETLAINNMGTHFSEDWAKDEYTYVGYIETGKNNKLIRK